MSSVSELGFSLALDTSGDWYYIAGVIVSKKPCLDLSSHIARINRRRRWKIVAQILDFIEFNGYGVCLLANLRSKIRTIIKYIANKNTAWRIALRFELVRLMNHLRSKGFWPIDVIFADNEFLVFKDLLSTLFRVKHIGIGKNEYVALADALAYTNFRNRKLLKRYKRIKELT